MRDLWIASYSFLMILCCASSGFADLLLTYNLQGVGGVPAFVAPNSTSAQIVGTNLTHGSGLVASNGSLNGANSFSATGWNSLTNQDYISFG